MDRLKELLMLAETLHKAERLAVRTGITLPQSPGTMDAIKTELHAEIEARF